MAAVGSQLVDLDGEVQAVGTDALRTDVAEAFVLWRAVSDRAEVWDGAADGGGRRRAEALAASWTPVVTATGETVGSGLADAMAFLDALIDAARRRGGRSRSRGGDRGIELDGPRRRSAGGRPGSHGAR